MKDIHIAIEVQKQKLTAIVLKHSGTEFILSKKYDTKKSIHQEEHKHDEKQTKLFNSFDWKLIKEKSKKVVENITKQEPEIWFKTNKGGFFKQKRSKVLRLIKGGYIFEANSNEIPQNEKEFEIEYIIKN